MRADNFEKFIVGLKILKSHLGILIDDLTKEPSEDKIELNKSFLRNITLDLRELYESYYLHKDKK